MLIKINKKELIKALEEHESNEEIILEMYPSMIAIVNKNMCVHDTRIRGQEIKE